MIELVKYNAMNAAIAICDSIDEVKDLQDKAQAMQLYANQANNQEAEQKCAAIRLRAQRRCGELTREIPKGRPGPKNDNSYRQDLPVTKPKDDVLADHGLQPRRVRDWEKLADIPEEEFEEAIAAVTEKKTPNTSDLLKNNLRGTQGTGDNEWYTPEIYLVAARKVLGTIDLDPASSAVANEVVGAAKYYTETDNGLVHPWEGKVWMNPPFAKDLMPEFAQKLVSEFTEGNVTEAIVLTHNYTDTKWFHALLSKTSAICFTKGRVKFYKACGEKAAPTQGQAFFYCGDNPKKFEEMFSEFGAVLRV